MCSAFAWTPGTYPAPSRDLTVDTQSRNDVLAFWHGVYLESDDFEDHIGWTGSYSTGAGAEGTNSATFITDTERRLNYYRAMVGVPATATLNTASTVFILSSDDHKPPAITTKAKAVQRAALMIGMNYTSGVPNPAYSHSPQVTSVWDAVPWNAMHNGNISQGFHGPNAIDAYISENIDGGAGGENFATGHRRWMLKPSSTNFATGDIPGTYNPNVGISSLRLPANVLYVTQNESETTTLTPAFTAYPPAGFFPAPLNAKFWSLSAPGADFSAATVSVSVVGGGAVATVKRSLANGFGDPTLVWEMPAEHAAASFPADTTYDVTVSGITAADLPHSHSYQVTLVNPDILASDQTLTGTDSPNPDHPANYFFTPPPNAEALRVNTYRQIPATWTEDAETGTPTAVTDETDAVYPLLFTNSSGDPSFLPITGSRSFRFTHPVNYTIAANGVPAQSFQIGGKTLPKTGARLTFKYKRGYMASASRLEVEMTDDGGATWASLGVISGNNTGSVENAASDASYPLPESLSPLSFRFRFYATPGSIYTHQQYPTRATGILIDDITVTNCDFLDPRMTTDLSAASTSFTLDSTTRGGTMAVGEQWQLALQTKLGNRWFPDGSLKTIMASDTVQLSPYELAVQNNSGISTNFDDDYDKDGIPNGVEFAFFTDPLEKNFASSEVLAPSGSSTISIRMPLEIAREGVSYEAECSENLNGSWTSENVTVTISGGFITATTPRPVSGKCFLRWKISLL